MFNNLCVTGQPTITFSYGTHKRLLHGQSLPAVQLSIKHKFNDPRTYLCYSRSQWVHFQWDFSFLLLSSNNKRNPIIAHIPFAMATTKPLNIIYSWFSSQIIQQVKQFRAQCTVPTFLYCTLWIQILFLCFRRIHFSSVVVSYVLATCNCSWNQNCV